MKILDGTLQAVFGRFFLCREDVSMGSSGGLGFLDEVVNFLPGGVFDAVEMSLHMSHVGFRKLNLADVFFFYPVAGCLKATLLEVGGVDENDPAAAGERFQSHAGRLVTIEHLGRAENVCDFPGGARNPLAEANAVV